MNLTRASRCRTYPACLICIAGLAALAACSSETEKLYPVKGKVTVDGKPLKKGSIAFHPNTKKNNTSRFIAAGEVTDGEYELFTNGKPGAPLGWYKVTVASEEPPDSSKPEKVKAYIGKEFTDPATTPWELEVVAAPGQLAYDLQGAK
jgi:hypothetical protein